MMNLNCQMVFFPLDIKDYIEYTINPKSAWGQFDPALMVFREMYFLMRG